MKQINYLKLFVVRLIFSSSERFSKNLQVKHLAYFAE